MFGKIPDWTWARAAPRRAGDFRRRKQAYRRRGPTADNRRYWSGAGTAETASWWAWSRYSGNPWFSGPRKWASSRPGTGSRARPDWHRTSNSSAPRMPSPLRLDPFQSLSLLRRRLLLSISEFLYYTKVKIDALTHRELYGLWMLHTTTHLTFIFLFNLCVCVLAGNIRYCGSLVGMGPSSTWNVLEVCNNLSLSSL